MAVQGKDVGNYSTYPRQAISMGTLLLKVSQILCQFYNIMCLLLRMFKDIGREAPVFNMFLDVEISVENLFIP